MNVFLSYSSEDRVIAEEIQLALVSDGHVVFFDAQSLPPGGDYRQRIKVAIERADALVCLISPSSVANDSYALTELNLARKRWPSPKQHVVPVIVREVNWALIPPYLKAVTILEPKGNTAAEVAGAVMSLRDNSCAEQVGVESNRSHSTWMADWRTTLAAALITLAVGAVTGWYVGRREIVPPTPISPSDLLRSSDGTGAGADVVFTNSTSDHVQIVWLIPRIT
jgi:hypothetical protein